jgi:hypothetical protein
VDQKLEIGTRVKTRKLGKRDFSFIANRRRINGAGIITGYSDSHGLCYRVLHDNETEAYYDPDELTILPSERKQ